MTLHHRSRRLTGALLASVALLWVMAPAAFASDRHRSSERERRYDAHRHDRHDRHDDRERGRRHGGWAWRGRHQDAHRAHRGGHARVASRRHAKPYYCKPCNHRFSSRRSFHQHLHHHHYLPIWAIPFAVIYWAATWTYHG